MKGDVMPISVELRSVLKQLKLGKLVDVLPDRMTLGRHQKMGFDEFLTLALGDEVSRRESTATERRAKTAGLDPDMRLERWDATAKVRFDKHVLNELVSLRFIEAHRNVVILGPVGVGKTFLASALGHIACRHRFTTRMVRADEMLRKLRQSRLDNSREALIVELTSVDLLIIDDFALEPMTREESRDVYQLFIERTGCGSMVITSNRDTAEWIATFDDVLLAQSAVDRVINAAYDLVVDGESYRTRLKPKLPSGDLPNTTVTKNITPGRRRRR